MARYVALLRGVNVSGKNIILMEKLVKSFRMLGFSDIKTYKQSGNVIFNAEKTTLKKLADQINVEIKQDFNLVVPALILSSNDLENLVKANPFMHVNSEEEKLLHCTFLFSRVSPELFGTLKLPVAEGEQAVLAGQSIFLNCPHGYGKTKLNNNYFERTLKVIATTRNWRTVLALHSLCSGC